MELVPVILNIDGGPGKFELSVSLFEDDTPGEGRRSVSFKLTEKHVHTNRIAGVIESVTREGEAGDELRLRLKLSENTSTNYLGSTYEKLASLLYNVRTRRGTIVLAKRTVPVPTP